MDFITFKKNVAAINIGKRLPDSVYVHVSALEYCPEILVKLVVNVYTALKIPTDTWNVVKFSMKDFKISLLNYPAFDTYAYPSLTKSYTVDLLKLNVREANYADSKNPPILHRKELFVHESHCNRSQFVQNTSAGEALGLYIKPRTIGFKNSWNKLIRSKGYYLDDSGILKPLSESVEDSTKELIVIDRHLTAIDRSQLSTPMKILANNGFLKGEHSILDYGCGKGDDIRELEAHGIDAIGWDPVHCPETDLINSDIVNLGFVINVIEDIEERNATLRTAWELTDKLLIVSVMIAGESVISQFMPYKDGVVTSRNTFQRYYQQAEFLAYVKNVLKVSPIAVGQGVCILFKSDLDEQNFQLKKQHIHRTWTHLTFTESSKETIRSLEKTITNNKELFDDFWQTTLDLGRTPANDEFDQSEHIRRLAGSHKKALDALIAYNGDSELIKAQNVRQEDLLVYFALSLFEKRKPYTHTPTSLKRDIKVFFESHSAALDEAKGLLFTVGNPENIERESMLAFEALKSGEIQRGHHWTLHKRHLDSLPPILRIYIGCATQLYGDLSTIQLIKIHFRSGKVTLLGYEKWETEQPLLIERIKIKLRDQDVDFFDYVGQYNPVPLLNKDDFV